MRWILWLLLFSPAVYAQTGVEITAAGKVQQYQGDIVRKGLGVRTRFTSLTPSKVVFACFADWNYSPFNPVVLPAAGWRFGQKQFVDLMGGLWIGTLMGQGISPAFTMVTGFEITPKFIVTIPIIWRLNTGLWGFTYLPYLGFRF